MTDPIVKDLQHALQLEKDGKSQDAITAAQIFLTRHAQHPAAIDAALLWTRHATHQPLAYYWLGNAYMYQGRFAEATSAFTLCTRLDPKNADAFAALGICIRSTGDIAAALNASKIALDLQPDHLRGHLNYMDCLYDMGYWEDSLAYGLEIVPHFPKENGVLMNIARLYGALGEIDQALEYHLKTIQNDPYHPLFRLGYLSALFKAGDKEEILKQIRITYQRFHDKPLYQKLMPVEWRKITYQNALSEGVILDKEKDAILAMRNIETLPDDHPHLRVADKTNPVWLLELSDLHCFSSDWAYFDEKNIYMNTKVTGKWFHFLMAYGMRDNAYIHRDFPHLTIDEPCLVLGGSDNYYHWLIDCLPRIAALDYYPHLKDLPIYINGMCAKFQKQSLAHLGIDESRIRLLPHDHIVTFKNAFAAYIPGRPMQANGEPDWMKPNDNPFIPEWLRKNFLRDLPVERKKRYFLSRASAGFRRVLNENEIFAIAQRYGFEKLDNQGKDFIEQVRLYAQADAVIGPHGAGFTNLAFAPQDATLIEFMPRRRDLPFYKALCGTIGQHYDTIEGPILKTFNDRSADFGDFHLDADAFTAMMEKYFGA